MTPSQKPTSKMVNELANRERNALIDSVFDGLDISEQTRKEYKYRIQSFMAFVGLYGLNVNSFLEYKRLLATKDEMAISTKNKYLAAARIFLKEMNRLGHLPNDITQNVKCFKQDKKHKKEGVTDEEMERITTAFREVGDSYPELRRIKAILGLLAFQGLRQIEIVRLNVEDVNLSRRTAFIHGKGRDDKEPIPLNPETIALLKEYLEYTGFTSGPLFRCQSGPNTNQRLTTRGLRLIITSFLQDMGINKTTHAFRHFFTTRLIKEYKGDLLEVSHYTRHRSLEMLQVYNDRLHEEADLPRFYEAFSGMSFR
jgi:integrase/recombinase XerC